MEGISEIDKENAEPTEAADLETFITAPRNMSVNKADNKFRISMPTRWKIDGITITKTAVLEKDGRWGINIHGVDVNLAKLGIDSMFGKTKRDMDNITTILSAINVCRGRQCEENEPHYNEKTSQHLLTGEEDVTQHIVKSAYCKGALGWLSRGTTCMTCRTMTRMKINAEIVLEENDHEEMSAILEKVFADAKPEMKVLLKSQLDALKSPLHGRRWPREVISTALSLWLRSPGGYDELKASDMIILPSGRQLQRYKNTIFQTPGVNRTQIQWMYKAAKSVPNLPDFGWSGGIIHDEVSIQEDLVISKRDGKVRILGFIDTGEEGNLLRKWRDKDNQLASEVIQLIFQGHTGFRFPLCHFPVDSVKASELYIIINSAIATLQDYGFHVDYVMQDGGQENRSYTNVVTSASKRFLATNVVAANKKIAICQDPMHNQKKMRNNCIKSGVPSKKTGKISRTIRLHDKDVVWAHWVSAAAWDKKREENGGRRIHYKLTKAHLEPSQSEKMRNALAEEALNSDMLYLMQSYQVNSIYIYFIFADQCQ